MLRNVSYKNEKQELEINELVGKPFGLFERIKEGGVGSGKLLITKADKDIENLLILDHNLNYCNIEMRPNGIIVYFRVLLETYALIIPYYKLVIFKVDAQEYTGGIAAGHQHLIHCLHLLASSHASEVVDRSANHLKDGPNTFQWLAGSAHQHREAAAFGAFRSAGDRGIQVVDVLVGQAFPTAFGCGGSNGGALQHHTASAQF